jgi:hypothetical protein
MVGKAVAIWSARYEARPARRAADSASSSYSSGQSICLGEQQVTEWLEPDLPAVEAADDAVDRSQIVVLSASVGPAMQNFERALGPAPSA